MRPGRLTFVIPLLLATLWHAVLPCSCLFSASTQVSNSARTVDLCAGKSVCCDQRNSHTTGSCSDQVDDYFQRVETITDRAPTTPHEHRKCHRVLLVTETEAGQQRGDAKSSHLTFDFASMSSHRSDPLLIRRVGWMELYSRWKTFEFRGTVRLQI